MTSSFFFVNEPCLLQVIFLSTIQPRVDELFLGGKEFRVDTARSLKLSFLVNCDSVKLSSEVSPNSLTSIDRHHFLCKSAFNQVFVVQISAGKTIQVECLENHGHLLCRNVLLDDDVIEDGDASLAKKSAHFSPNFTMVVRMVESVLRDHKVERTVLENRQVIKILVDDSVIFEWDASLLRLLLVEHVLVVADIRGNNLVQLVHLQELKGQVSCEGATSRSQLDDSQLSVCRHVLLDELPDFLVSLGERLGVSLCMTAFVLAT